jgi:hypothetical protein
MYALAATAAGVGMLALAPAAAARIVYTPAHVTLPIGQFYGLDLNHDGKTDFAFYHGSQCHEQTCVADVFISNVAGNEMWGQHHSASALRAGVRIGSRGKFSSSAAHMADWVCFCQTGHTSTRFSGQWANGGKGVKNRYLGLKFQINGKIHFGWARLNVKFKPSGQRFSLVATLTGYAYETVANRPIVTGKTKRPVKISSADQANDAEFSVRTPKPATLGLLAMGAPGLSIWRREESAASPLFC